MFNKLFDSCVPDYSGTLNILRGEFVVLGDIVVKVGFALKLNM